MEINPVSLLCSLSSVLELQAALAGGVGQGLDAAVVAAPAAVEGDGLDAGGLGSLGDRLADPLGRLDVRAGLQLAADLVDRARRRGQRAAVEVVDDLGVDVLP